LVAKEGNFSDGNVGKVLRFALIVVLLLIIFPQAMLGLVSHVPEKVVVHLLVWHRLQFISPIRSI
jgi:hypothetical protein